jgi:hypothetical protein
MLTMRICKRCVLPETFPGIRFGDESMCSFCLSDQAQSGLDARAQTIRREFERLVQDTRGQDGYHCVLAYSGGKDSTYALWLLCKHYDLRVLAVTFDNGFNSPQSFVNIRRVLDSLSADWLVVRPRQELLRSVFAGISSENPYPMKALERASSVCNACIAFVKNIVLRVALEHHVPMIAYGWSPGQAPVRGALFQMNESMLRRTHEVRTAPLRPFAGNALKPFTVDDALIAQCRPLPHSVHPLAFHDYDERSIRRQIELLGWCAPKDTDGNSSNCRLNSLANRLHLKRYGFHPYAFEVAGLVRAGMLTRDEGLAHLADLGDEEIARSVAQELGIADVLFTA